MKNNFFYKIINSIKKITNKREVDLSCYPPATDLKLTRDEIKINLWGLDLSVKRETTSDIPTELSVIVPRAEYRDKEIILNSITIIFSPRHPPADKPSPLSVLAKPPKKLKES